MHTTAMFRNFTVVDVLGSIEATLLLALFLFVPGYVTGWATNVFEFRRRRPVLRLLLSTPLALAVCPILIFLIGRYRILLWAVFALIWLALVLIVGGQLFMRRQSLLPQVSREVRIGAIMVGGWAIIAIASLVDLQIHDRLYFSVSAFDYSVRTALTAAAARSIPPTNPFFFAEPGVPLRYHYFWMLLCGMVTRLAGVSPRHAMYGGTVWAGIALLSLIGIGLKFFTRTSAHLERQVLIGCALLAVTGLDIIPTLLLYARYGIVSGDMEWWNTQITSWADSLLWVPHHVCAMVVCLLGFLMLRQSCDTKRGRLAAVLLAGMGFASAAGMSALVTLTFALSMIMWVLLGIFRRWWSEVGLCLAAGAVALFVALPYLLQLRGPAFASDYVELSVRSFPWAVYLLRSLHLSAVVINGLLLPLNYFLELGFFLAVAVLRFKALRSASTKVTREEVAAWVLVLTSFMIGTATGSTVTPNNDLGYRCFLQAQFIFLLWAAVLLDEWWSARRTAAVAPARRRLRYILGALLVLGFVGTAYQVVNLRVFPILYDAGKENGPHWLGADRQLGKRTYALRSAYETVGTDVPSSGVVQSNPWKRAYLPHLLYSEHNSAVGLPLCGTAFGGDPVRCLPRQQTLVSLFQAPTDADAARLDGVCQELLVDVLVVDDTDVAWRRKNSWVWTRPPLVANDYMRAFRCGYQAQRAELRVR